MSISSELRLLIRQRADYACEYCGVSETDSGGELTIDHYHPQRHGGADTEDNLLYACPRCNLYKSDYWPTDEPAPMLWNPRRERRDAHILALVDGTLYPLTLTGAFTIQRLRLNRPPLVAHRRRQYEQMEETRLLAQFRDIVALLEQLQQQHAALLDEQRALLEQQRALLTFLLANK
jgi:hypothetical protein